MRKVRLGQWYIDEETGEVVVKGTDEWEDDEPDKMNWRPSEDIEIRFPATIEITPIEQPTQQPQL